MRDEYNELLAFCVTSAIGCMDEPPIYGSLRLIDCMARVIRLGRKAGITDGEAFEELEKYIENNKLSCMYNEEAFRQVLREAVFRLIEISKQETPSGS